MMKEMLLTRKSKTEITWKNKTIAEFEAGPNVLWVAQLTVSSDGRKFRSIKQVIVKRNGQRHHINGFVFKNETSGQEIKGMIKLLKAILPKETAND
jgi:hypothetical protein